MSPHFKCATSGRSTDATPPNTPRDEIVGAILSVMESHRLASGLFALSLLMAPCGHAQAPAPPPPPPRPAVAPPPASAGGLGFGLQDNDPYARGVARAQSAPLAAFNEAQAWRAAGGGEAARHCAALALLEGGDAALAAEEFERLARDMRLRPAPVRAQILSQAARAWLAAEDLKRAHAAASAALDLHVDDPDLWIDRAEILAADGRLWEAVDDLDQAVDRAPRRADALVMRAAAYRRLEARELAREDLARALALDPRSAEAWLERGMLNRLAGDLPAARRDWLQVLLLDADGPAGEAARTNIHALETGQQQAPSPSPSPSPTRPRR
jgi:tetratricopeptide (TPR) repeat protein